MPNFSVVNRCSLKHHLTEPFACMAAHWFSVPLRLFFFQLKQKAGHLRYVFLPIATRKGIKSKERHYFSNLCFYFEIAQRVSIEQ